MDDCSEPGEERAASSEYLSRGERLTTGQMAPGEGRKDGVGPVGRSGGSELGHVGYWRVNAGCCAGPGAGNEAPGSQRHMEARTLGIGQTRDLLMDWACDVRRPGL